MDLPKERLPTSAIGSRFQSGLVPLTVERVEGDPLVEQDLVGVANGIKLFDFAQPTARSKPFLKPGAFHLQQIQAVSIARLHKRLGTLLP